MSLPSSTDDERRGNIIGWHCEDSLDFKSESRSPSSSVSRSDHNTHRLELCSWIKAPLTLQALATKSWTRVENDANINAELQRLETIFGRQPLTEALAL